MTQIKQIIADLFSCLSILYNLWSSVVSVSSVCNLIFRHTLFLIIQSYGVQAFETVWSVRVGEEEGRHGKEYQSQHPVEPPGLFPSHIAHHELCVACREKPVPIQQSRPQRDKTGQRENALYDILANHTLTPDLLR